MVALAVVGAAVLRSNKLAPRAAPPTIRYIAVLPLRNLSRDPEQEFFADGTTEALISSLAQIHALRVISRTSVMRFKGTTKPVPEIARELGVDAVVEGSVQRAGGRVLITAQLIEASTDTHLWAKDYERDLADVLHLEAEVSRAIAQEIGIQVTSEEHSRPAFAGSIRRRKKRTYWDAITGGNLTSKTCGKASAISSRPSSCTRISRRSMRVWLRLGMSAARGAPRDSVKSKSLREPRRGRRWSWIRIFPKPTLR
jgi:TolB-like protein